MNFVNIFEKNRHGFTGNWVPGCCRDEIDEWNELDEWDETQWTNEGSAGGADSGAGSGG